ncbi:hypothetical protein CVT24_004798 [Panaeolus cyanescens]|uniref:Uncharacterized protein n=1 Tax=Panaeolus cyanescens TaxID=181874 RepID=A0A409VQA6_9AGAR|nr:hypothetical protein CVT24_004798 [Panaeolus cyanescens]
MRLSLGVASLCALAALAAPAPDPGPTFTLINPTLTIIRPTKLYPIPTIIVPTLKPWDPIPIPDPGPIRQFKREEANAA